MDFSVMVQKSGKLFVVSAPSGAGKTTIELRALAILQKKYPLRHGITYTTRSPRPGEVHGRDFFFIGKEEFLKKIKVGFFLEYSSAYGNYYGTPRSILKDVSLGKSFILVIDRCGAQQVKQAFPDACLIHIVVPENVSLAGRLSERGTEVCDEISRRVLVSQKELLLEKEHPLYDYTIVNVCVERAVDEFVAIIEKKLSS